MTETTETIIDRLYEDNKALVDYLQSQGQYSLLSNVEGSFPKVLLLAVASYFEDIIKQMILDLFQEQTNAPLINFVANKAIKRQYHTFFDWKESNANQFFGLFGDDFKNAMKAEIKANPQLDQAVRAFMEIGQTRNALVHENFATFPLPKTTEEIYHRYQEAMVFLELLPLKFREHIENSPPA
ncbi:MAG: hypothetical protein HC884_14125 [Chloroflexaceae bacterium]|nr:hypothetical protein [Chloroflexaceae bacterium]